MRPCDSDKICKLIHQELEKDEVDYDRLKKICEIELLDSKSQSIKSIAFSISRMKKLL